MESDRDLLESWRGGDRDAGNVLLKRHFDAVYRFFRNKVDDTVEDLVQRTFIGCVEGRDRFREEASFRTYLFAVAHNILREYYRARRRSPEASELDEASIVELGAGPTSVLVARAEERLLLAALRRIPLTAQVLLELYFWEEWTGPELGRFLGVPEDTARSRLRRAKQQLSHALSALQASPEVVASTVSNLEDWARALRIQMVAAT